MPRTSQLRTPLLVSLVTGLAVAGVGAPAHGAAQVEALAEFSLEQLSELEVMSVSKTTEQLRRAPASIYVITHDDILRSGVTSLVEALRLAPNLQLTQYASNHFVAGARGFAGAQEAQNFSNKLLILVDGRSVYSPLYSGVYLDVQDVMLEDVDRIEVISGPGATLWGANAMHGVINVITRPTYLTDTSTATVALGNEEQMAAARVGMRWSQDVSYRVYGKAFSRGESELVDGSGAEDGWHKGQAGFRIDRNLADTLTTLQGDIYRGDEQLQQPGGNLRVEGANLLGRWQRHDESSEWQVQGYYDYTSRAEPADGVAFTLHTVDFELQARHQLGRHRLVWGGGVRVHDYSIEASEMLSFEPAERTLTLGNLFMQDTLRLTPTLDLALGLKAERDTFSGWNVLPDVRLSWQAREQTFVWAAASRAIRSPTPFDQDVVERFGGIVAVVGNDDFEPERVDAFEVGVRGQPGSRFTYSASLFYNVYDDLRTIEPASATDPLPYSWGNLMEGNTYGLEAWLEWQVADWWRLSPGMRLLQQDLEFSPGAQPVLGLSQAGNDPTSQALLNSSMDLGHDLTLEATLRHVGDLPQPELDAYHELSLSLGWHPLPDLEVSLSGFNLLDSRHLEYPAPSGRYIRRSVLAQARWRF